MHRKPGKDKDKEKPEKKEDIEEGFVELTSGEDDLVERKKTRTEDIEEGFVELTSDDDTLDAESAEAEEDIKSGVEANEKASPAAKITPTPQANTNFHLTGRLRPIEVYTA